MQRRYILFLILICLCVKCDGVRRQRDTYDKNVKVLVLGAGVAGMNAAKTLYEAGYTNIQVLEAKDRIGGRIKNVNIGDHSVELGAVWIYGKGSNPVFQLAEKHRLSTVVDEDSWVVRDSNGKNVTAEADELYYQLEDAIEGLMTYVPSSKDDFNVAGGLKYFNWTEKSNVAEAVETFTFEYELSVPPFAHSGKHLNLYNANEDFESYELLVTNHSSGFVHVIERMSENFTNSEEDSVLFNTVVNEIEYGDEYVKVKTVDGRTFEADFAIVTFSLGVLQQRMVNFNPVLPDRKQFAINTFGFGSCTYIYVQFSRQFWDDTSYIVYASTMREMNYIIMNMNVVKPGSNILFFSLSDTAGEWAEKEDESNVIAELLTSLQKMYPNAIIPEPTDYVMSRWNTDPFTYGVWSYWPPGFSVNDMEKLKAPVGRLYFAGEYTHELHFGFVHGAYLSGERVAQQVIGCIEDSVYCNKLADWDTSDGDDDNDNKYDGGVKCTSNATLRLFSSFSNLAITLFVVIFASIILF
ncbi:hypothetical protein ACF0H5_020742 [Mactra antiquata]